MDWPLFGNQIIYWNKLKTFFLPPKIIVGRWDQLHILCTRSPNDSNIVWASEIWAFKTSFFWVDGPLKLESAFSPYSNLISLAATKMAETEKTDKNKLTSFEKTGLYRFENSNAVFIDPVRMLNRHYSRFKLSASVYYSRFFESTNLSSQSVSRKRKRKDKTTSRPLNEKEQLANQRHLVVLFVSFFGCICSLIVCLCVSIQCD